MSGQNHKMVVKKDSSRSPAIFSNPWASYKPDNGTLTKEINISVKPVEIGKIFKNLSK